MYNIICLKHGTKYGPEYVNKLRNMIERHTTLPFDFFCLTENHKGINSAVTIIPLPNNLRLDGWWWKPYVFKENLFASNSINFFIDLDMVIIDNIDKLLTYLPDQFVGLKDVGRVFGHNQEKLGSAVLKWPVGSYTNVWTNIEHNLPLIKQYRGDQDYLWHHFKNNIKFYPDSWIRSYKWEVRSRSELTKIGTRWNFKEIRDPLIEKETAILAFHGSPDPHEVKDPVIVNNWR